MSFQEHLTQMTALRQQALAQQHQQRQAIVTEWKPIVHQLLQALGENAWGKDRYTIIEPDQSTTWTLVNFKGSKNSQFYVVLDFEPVDVDAVLATDSSLPNELTRAVGFRVIGGSTFNAGLSQPELERILVAALQKGPNQEPLPAEITKALSRFPYQADEYDQRPDWKNFIMTLAGPVTVLVGVVVTIAALMELSNNVSKGAVWHWIAFLIFWSILGLVFMVSGHWATQMTVSGRRYNKLPPRQKRLATVAMLPGMVAIVFISIVLIAGIIALISGAAAEAQKSEVRQAVHDELREHGL